MEQCINCDRKLLVGICFLGKEKSCNIPYLSDVFVKTVREWLTADQIKLVNAGTKQLNEFCDSDMLMFEILDENLADYYESMADIPNSEAEYTAFFKAYQTEGEYHKKWGFYDATNTPIHTIEMLVLNMAHNRKFEEVKS
mgnify:FL=1